MFMFQKKNWAGLKCSMNHKSLEAHEDECVPSDSTENIW